MRTHLASKMVLVVTVAAGFSTSARAQGDSPKPTPRAEQQNRPSKSHSHKLWTNDDMSSVRSSADVYVDARETHATAAPAPNQSPTAKPAQHTAAPALSNPKTIDDADNMIAWEKRDVDAQTEYLELLKKQIEEASPEDKERLKKVLQERTQILADTRSEMETLVGQKKELQKKATANDHSAAAEPPPQ